MKTIKVPTPRKLPSGNWFIQLSVNGQRISVTEPTEKACIARAMAIKEDLLKPLDRSQKPTLTVAIDRYIEARQNILSPATLRGYRIIQKYRFQSAMNRPVNAYDENGWQKLVNAEAKIVSAKTLQNSWRFISSVLCDELGTRYTIRLPQIVSDPREFLDPEQIPIFVKAICKTKYAVPALMALCSLRRSELLAVKWSDIDLEAGTIQVRGAVVPSEDGKMVLKKENKNRTSRRTVPIMIPQLKELLLNSPRTSEFVVTLNASSVLSGINRVCRQENLPEIGIHGLRHSFASLAYHLNMPEKIAMQIGGWEDDATMKKIYTHIAQKDLAEYSAAMSSYYSSKFTNEITNES